ncbi:glycosyltransferase family 39 protein [Neoconidiobolus thromboides FSU 785]|nr:glycosyltransferase family 39 protein [Neoconidiobolus thromboides FSU 785]
MEKEYLKEKENSSIDYDDSEFKYSKSSVKNDQDNFFSMSKRDWYLVGLIGIVGLLVRFFRISQPASVVFDEVHFGGFAAKYIKRDYFFDVHPPLAKLMIAAVGWFFGFDGSFDFEKIGKEFAGNHVPYTAMRLAQALFGWFLIPTAYLTSKVSGLTTEVAALGSLLVLFENALITQSRYIFLDSPLILFTALSVLFWSVFCNYEKKAFSKGWWLSLASTGIFLGLTLSCKWVGLFAVALIGISTIRQLWELVGDLKVTPSKYLQHFVARALCLIIIPISIYMFTFQVQFMVLNKYTESANSMSSEFQNTLEGNGLVDAKKDVIYGSKLRINHVATAGGYLHSHAHTYPGGSKQQQVTLYPFRDNNNFWTIVKPHDSKSEVNNTETIEYIKDKDIVRLIHVTTSKHLHSHELRPVFSSKDYVNEVSGYGFDDSNDNFRVEISKGDSRDPESKERLMAIYTKFRLVHVNTGCVLYSRPKKLPEWGFGQQEVICIKNGQKPRSEWVVEFNDHELLKDSPKVSYGKIGFLSKFMELNHRMWTANNGLTSSHPYDSRPQDWPFLRRGISFWGKEHAQVYLIGNPFIWYAGSMSIIAYMIFQFLSLILTKRNVNLASLAFRQRYFDIIGFFVMGWVLHIFPFFIMKRQLFLHHYLPALYFSILAFAATVDLTIRRLRPQFRLVVALIITVAAVSIFAKFSYLAYGLNWTKAACKAAKWKEHWDFDCNRQLD